MARHLLAANNMFITKVDRDLVKTVLRIKRQSRERGDDDKLFRVTPIPAKGSLTNPAIGA